MSVNVSIQRSELANKEQNAVAVYATATGIFNATKPSDILVALSSASKERFRAVAGSVLSLHNVGSGVHVLRALMIPTKHVLPAAHKDNMVALSSSMYMDSNDRLWSLKQSGNESLLISSQSEDPEELLEMMASCSNDIAVAGNPELRNAINAHNNLLKGIQGGDAVSYLSNSGEMKSGFVAFVSVASDEEVLSVLPFGGQEVEDVDRASVSAVYQGDAIDYPEVNLSVSGQVSDPKALVDYYRRVYGHAPEYFERLRQIIMNHNFA